MTEKTYITPEFVQGIIDEPGILGPAIVELANKYLSLLDQLEAERQRADEYRDCIRVLADQLSENALPKEVIEAVAALKGEQVPVASELIPEGMKYSSALPEFVGDSNEISSYRCWIHANTRKVATQEQAYADAKAVCELFTAPQKPVVLPEINEDLVDILGRPNFTCSGIAGLFRRNGADIKRKSENEQAFVIHWLIGVYLTHGSEWRATAEAELKSIADKIKADGYIVKTEGNHAEP